MWGCKLNVMLKWYVREASHCVECVSRNESPSHTDTSVMSITSYINTLSHICDAYLARNHPLTHLIWASHLTWVFHKQSASHRYTLNQAHPIFFLLWIFWQCDTFIWNVSHCKCMPWLVHVCRVTFIWNVCHDSCMCVVDFGMVRYHTFNLILHSSLFVFFFDTGLVRGSFQNRQPEVLPYCWSNLLWVCVCVCVCVRACVCVCVCVCV